MTRVHASLGNQRVDKPFEYSLSFLRKTEAYHSVEL